MSGARAHPRKRMTTRARMITIKIERPFMGILLSFQNSEEMIMNQEKGALLRGAPFKTD